MQRYEEVAETIQEFTRTNQKTLEIIRDRKRSRIIFFAAELAAQLEGILQEQQE